METTLHKQLKEFYAGASAATEVSVGKYRIDAVNDDVLYEIQHGSLSAIRRKIQDLQSAHKIVVVKPLIALKTIVKQDARGGAVVSRRRSPKRASFVASDTIRGYSASTLPLYWGCCQCIPCGHSAYAHLLHREKWWIMHQAG